MSLRLYICHAFPPSFICYYLFIIVLLSCGCLCLCSPTVSTSTSTSTGLNLNQYHHHDSFPTRFPTPISLYKDDNDNDNATLTINFNRNLNRNRNRNRTDEFQFQQQTMEKQPNTDFMSFVRDYFQTHVVTKNHHHDDNPPPQHHNHHPIPINAHAHALQQMMEHTRQTMLFDFSNLMKHHHPTWWEHNVSDSDFNASFFSLYHDTNDDDDDDDDYDDDDEEENVATHFHSMLDRYSNLSSVSLLEQWMEEFQYEIQSMESAEQNAKELVQSAMESLENVTVQFKATTSNVLFHDETLSILNTRVNQSMQETQMYLVSIVSKAMHHNHSSAHANANANAMSARQEGTHEYKQNDDHDHHKDVESNPKSSTSIKNQNLLYQKNTWEQAGFQTIHSISPKHALEFIKHLNLQTYQIQDDLKGELNVLNPYHNKEERRTRRHVGVLDTHGIVREMHSNENENGNGNVRIEIDGEDNNNNNNNNNNQLMAEPSFLFAYNLKAMEGLAIKSEKIKAQLEFLQETTSLDKTNNNNSSNVEIPTLLYTLPMRIQNLTQSILPSLEKEEEYDNDDGEEPKKRKFKSMAQLATEVVVLESEASSATLDLLLLRIQHWIRMNIARHKFKMQMKVLKKEQTSNKHTMRLEQHLLYNVTDYEIQGDANVDSIILMMDAVGQISSIQNESIREQLRMQEAERFEAKSAREKILEEASEERASEALSILKINLLGEEATKEIIETIRVIFQNLVRAIHHTMYTKEGNRQFLFFTMASSLLTFCILAIRETIHCVFQLLRRFVLAPRLVREYGNLYGWNSGHSHDSSILEDFILPPNIQERALDFCNTTTKAKRRGAPLKNILLHGPPGTGKTMIAKAIAKISSNIPFAIMSGADVAPLGQNGPLELKKLLTWASSRKGGVIVIIDEAESALGSRMRDANKSLIEEEYHEETSSGSNNFSRDVLNVMLSMTGSSSTNFMLILTTSTPSALDEAVLDRMDEMIELTLLGKRERKNLLMKEFTKRFGCSMKETTLMMRIFSFFFSKRGSRKLPIDDDFNIQLSISTLAQDKWTKGLSGRELKKIIMALESEVYLSDNCTLNSRIWNNITTRLCNDMKVKNEFKRIKTECW